MSYWSDDTHYRHETVTVRALWVTIALSLLVHFAALLLWVSRTPVLAPGDDTQKLTGERLQVQLAAIPRPLPAPTPEPPREIAATPKPATQAPRPTPRTRPPPALSAPTLAAPAVPTPPPLTPPAPVAPRTTPPVESDLWSYIQARRRERGEQQAPSVDNPRAEPNANIAANLPAPATGVAGRDPRKGNGIFEIKRMDYDNAAFEFFGWNNEMERRTPQLIEVRIGSNSDMRIAVVRRMITIIREHANGDFVWRSPRHENGLMLSARLADNAALESFLIHDLFDDPRQLR